MMSVHAAPYHPEKSTTSAATTEKTNHGCPTKRPTAVYMLLSLFIIDFCFILQKVIHGVYALLIGQVLTRNNGTHSQGTAVDDGVLKLQEVIH